MNITQQDREMAHKVFVDNFHLNKTDEDIFYELIFCICVPQTTFKNTIKVIDKLREIDYYHFTDNKLYLEGGEQEYLWEIIKPVRFYRNKAKYVVAARKNFSDILVILKYPFLNSSNKRAWLVQSVKGLGMKTASHLLRNLGATNLAIIDIHVLKYLNVLHKDRTMDQWKYDDLEERFKKKAKAENLSVAELDIIVWKKYSKTEWVDYVK